MGSRLGTLTIPSGSSASPARTIGLGSGALAIQAPAALDDLTFTIEVSNDGNNWATYNTGSSALELEAGDAPVIAVTPWVYLRIKASDNVAANRVFTIAR